jgi:hypothetical protein
LLITDAIFYNVNPLDKEFNLALIGFIFGVLLSIFVIFFRKYKIVKQLALAYSLTSLIMIILYFII